MNMVENGRGAGLRVQMPLAVLAALMMLSLCPGGSAQADIFPTYPCMAPNVDFWVRIYTEFESTQGVLHDKYRLDVIYEAIDLKAPGTAGSRITNRQRIQNAKAKYRVALTRLARGARPRNALERRVQRLFGPRAVPGDFKAAAGHLRCQIGQKDRFRAGLIRSGAYIVAVKSIFRDSGLPEALAYLPHVESSYHPGARSKSGAVGIWQFTRATGGRYLRITPELDERLDPLAATRGAAALLRHNYRKFGSWPLAITAYNHGTAGVLQARRSGGGYEAIFKNYRSRRFRFASRNFYSEFLAARQVAENFRAYFGELDLKKPPRFLEVELDGYVSLPRLIAHFRLDRSEVHRLNPALRPAVLNGRRYVPKGFRLRLPVEGNTCYTADLGTLYQRFPPAGSTTHTVRPGDTAARIAGIHGVRLSDLIAANALDARARIFPGQILEIPGSRRPSPGRGEMPGTAKKTGGTKSGNEPETTVSSASAAAGGGDWQTYGHPLPGEIPCPVLKVDVYRVRDVHTRKGRQLGVVHVQAQETIGHYAEWLEVPARDIRRLNALRYGRSLRLNQKIKLPLHRTSKSVFEARRLDYHRGLAQEFFSRYRVAGTTTYTVRKGDNIWRLANQQFNVPVWLIERFNHQTDFGALTPARRLIIPVIDEREIRSSARELPSAAARRRPIAAAGRCLIA